MFMLAGGDTVAVIQRTWAEFETAVGLKGRKFYGTYDSRTNEYRVCVQLKDGDEPQARGLQVATIPRGSYLCARLQASRQGSMTGFDPRLATC